jgi:cytochrome c peroxidase
MKHIFILTLLSLSAAYLHAEEEADPAEVLLGERLFMETRFAQFFKTHMDTSGNVNIPLTKGDPALDKTVRFFGLPPYQIPFIDGPYAGQSINCRTCHLVDEHLGEEGHEQSELGMRSYADFASRSPVPTREDGQTTTVRNSPVLVDISRPRDHFILHLDGEFSSVPELVRGTLTDRNMGWLPGEKDLAIEHICKVIREDDGSSPLAEEFGGLSYTEAFKGSRANDKSVESEYLIPQELRIDVQKANCEKVFNAVANTIAIYTNSLLFAEDGSIISPYDLFLEINHLPTNANENESNLEYSKRLMQNIQTLHKAKKLQFVEKNPNTEDGEFEFHDTPYVFGKQELAGMQVFFNQAQNDENSLGNCIACHPAPHFTDHGIHNTGITQVEYDALHGQDAFNKLKIPNLSQRNKKADLYLPATHQHPKRKGIFRSVPSETDAMKTDLGAWNIVFNSDYPLSQESLYSLICIKDGKVVCTSRNNVLEKSVARFKTPTLRNLGHSAPYMHNGQISDLHAVTSFYLAASINTRQGQFRNPDEDIAKIDIKPKDLNPLVLFLRSLYEDYN